MESAHNADLFRQPFNTHDPAEIQRFFRAFETMHQAIRVQATTIEHLRATSAHAYQRSETNHTTSQQQAGVLRDHIAAGQTRTAVAEAELRRLQDDLSHRHLRTVSDPQFPQ